MSSKRNNKRARTEEEEKESSSPDEDKDVRLSEGLRALFGNRKYVKEREISRDHLMRYLCGKGEITEVRLVHVSIQPFGGSCFPIVLDEQQNSVSHLKRAIQEEQGTPIFSQQLFLLGKSADDARGEPLGEEEIVTNCSIAMCVLTNGKLLYLLLLIIIRSLLCFLLFSQKGASGIVPQSPFR